MSYLNEVRSTEVANGYKEDIDTALLKLYAEANHESLLDLLVSENFCLLTDSAAWLEKHKKWVDFLSKVPLRPGENTFVLNAVEF